MMAIASPSQSGHFAENRSQLLARNSIKLFFIMILPGIHEVFQNAHTAVSRWVKGALAFLIDASEKIRLDLAKVVEFYALDRSSSQQGPKNSGIFAFRRLQRGVGYGHPHRVGLIRKLLDMSPRTNNRTTISLTDSEIEALESLKEHFDTQSVSETIRRSISQSSLLKRYSDEDGDLVVEKAGKRFVIPSHR